MKQLWKSDRQNIISLLCLTLLLFLVPLRWLGAVLTAALIHEFGHYCAVMLSGGKVHHLKIGPTGAVMEASGLTASGELISILAGPLVGLLPLMTVRFFPTIAICSLIQSAYNLLPIYPLDGGRLLRRIILLHGGTEHSFHIIEYTVLFLLFLVCIYIQIMFHFSLFPLMVVLLSEKHLANRRNIGYNRTHIVQNEVGNDERYPPTNSPTGAKTRTIHRRRV